MQSGIWFFFCGKATYLEEALVAVEGKLLEAQGAGELDAVGRHVVEPYKRRKFVLNHNVLFSKQRPPWTTYTLCSILRGTIENRVGWQCPKLIENSRKLPTPQKKRVIPHTYFKSSFRLHFPRK